MGLAFLEETPQISLAPPGGQLSPESDCGGTLIWDVRLPELKEINFCILLATQFMVFRDSGSNRLRHRRSAQGDPDRPSWVQ